MSASAHPDLALPKPQPLRVVRLAKRRAKKLRMQAVRTAVVQRDCKLCRCCNRRRGTEVHHIVYRSQGGLDAPRNLILLCQQCHGDIHGRRVAVSYDAADPAGTIRFARCA